MRSPQFCCLLLAVSLMPGTPLLAGARELQDPENQVNHDPRRVYSEASPIASNRACSQDLSGHLFLQEMLGLGHPHQDTPNRSLRSTIPWQPPPPPRPRKAGCKNFYWKTLTSC